MQPEEAEAAIALARALWENVDKAAIEAARERLRLIRERLAQGAAAPAPPDGEAGRRREAAEPYDQDQRPERPTTAAPTARRRGKRPRPAHTSQHRRAAPPPTGQTEKRNDRARSPSPPTSRAGDEPPDGSDRPGSTNTGEPPSPQ